MEEGKMKILVFLHGTLIMHKNGVSKTREERVKQSNEREESVSDFANYVPVENAADKVREWADEGAEIIYLSSHETREDVEKDKLVLDKYNFPKGEVLFRENDESYADIAEKVMPDILIEDNCESIGGEKEMTYTNIKSELKPQIKHIIVKEFEGIDHLPDDLSRYAKVKKKAAEEANEDTETYMSIKDLS